MKVSVEHSELTQERKRALANKPELRREAWRVVRGAAFSLERWIKSPPPVGMPVDIGRARASWGHSTAPADGSDGIWTEDEPNLTVIEGSKVEYIQRLNEGWSRQAPAGFIDAAATKVHAELAAALDDVLKDVL